MNWYRSLVYEDKTYDNIVVTTNGLVGRLIDGKIKWLKRKPNIYGYLTCYIKELKTKILIHRIVAYTFPDLLVNGTKEFPKNHKDLCVHHVNVDGWDNRACNLEWVTRAQNILYYFNDLVINPRKFYKGKRAKYMERTKDTLNIIVNGVEISNYVVNERGEVGKILENGKIQKRKLVKNRDNYLSVAISGIVYRVNRIVCETFHGSPPSPDYEADHINGLRIDNRKNNIQWLSPKENKRKRENTILNKNDIWEIYSLYDKGISRSKIANDKKITYSYLHKILKGRSWSDIYEKYLKQHPHSMLKKRRKGEFYSIEDIFKVYELMETGINNEEITKKTNMSNVLVGLIASGKIRKNEMQDYIKNNPNTKIFKNNHLRKYKGTSKS